MCLCSVNLLWITYSWKRKKKKEQGGKQKSEYQAAKEKIQTTTDTSCWNAVCCHPQFTRKVVSKILHPSTAENRRMALTMDFCVGWSYCVCSISPCDEVERELMKCLILFSGRQWWKSQRSWWSETSALRLPQHDRLMEPSWCSEGSHLRRVKEWEQVPAPVRSRNSQRLRWDTGTMRQWAFLAI